MGKITNRASRGVSLVRMPKQQLPFDFKPNNATVLRGKGKECYESTGNRRFRVIATIWRRPKRRKARWLTKSSKWFGDPVAVSLRLHRMAAIGKSVTRWPAKRWALTFATVFIPNTGPPPSAKRPVDEICGDSKARRTIVESSIIIMALR